MPIFFARPIGYIAALFASFIMAGTVGCASGGFKLTRQYARFVNKQMIIIRIVLYLLTSIVFAVTMMVDLVIFNTIDFWQGKVSAGEYQFNQGEKTFHVRHEVLPGGPLKRSAIEVFDTKNALLQTIVLLETTSGDIELHIDGKLHSKVRDLSGLPMIATFDRGGNLLSDKIAMFEMSVPTVIAKAQ